MGEIFVLFGGVDCPERGGLRIVWCGGEDMMRRMGVMLYYKILQHGELVWA